MASLDRVVAIHATFDGQVSMPPKIGSGYLLDNRTVLTAAHVLQGPSPDLQWAASLRVTRALDLEPVDVALRGSEVVVAGIGADWAMIHLPGLVKTPIRSANPRFKMLDQRRSGTLEDCVVIGYPQFAADRSDGPAHREVHGRIDLTDGADSGYFMMQSDRRPASARSGSAWAGLSGGVVFHGEHAIGIVTAHSSRDGAAVFTVSGLPSSNAIPDVRVRALLGIVETVDGLSDVLLELEVKEAANLAEVRNVTPYDLGASNWRLGSESDAYVPRKIDDILDKELTPGCFVLIRGGPKSGKTRTAYEALRRNYPDVLVLAMDPSTLGTVMRNPAIAELDRQAVLWLDDAEQFMRSESALTRALVSELRNRPGFMIVGTIRSDQAGLVERSDMRSVYGMAHIVLLPYANYDPAEHVACESAYPDVDLREFSLPEQLVGAPAFEVIYEESRYGDPSLRAVLETAIDWVRTGTARGIGRSLLLSVAHEIARSRYGLDENVAAIDKAIARACAPLMSTNGSPLHGRMSALRSVGLEGGENLYLPLDYLVTTDRECLASDVGGDAGGNATSDKDWFELGDPGRYSGRRDVPDALWIASIDGATLEDAFDIALNARVRAGRSIADRALQRAADVGSSKAMVLWARELIAMAGQIEREA